MSKTKSRSTLLLKIVSVLFIVYGIYFIVASILSLVGETIVISGMDILRQAPAGYALCLNLPRDISALNARTKRFAESLD